MRTTGSPRSGPFWRITSADFSPRAEIAPIWRGRTVAIIASGPSLCARQLSALKAAHARGAIRVIAINNSWERAPWADMLYACDARWWDHYRPSFSGLRISRDPDAGEHAALTCSEPGKGFSLDPRAIRCGGDDRYGGNSGFQAVNLALHLGASNIILIGFDMGAGPDGSRHSHPDHTGRGLTNPKPDLLAAWARAFDAAAPALLETGVRVINASVRTEIKGFERATVAAALRKVGPQTPTAYTVSSERTSPRWCAAFAEGCGGKVSRTKRLKPGPVAMFGSPALMTVLTAAREQGRDWYYGDHAYFGRWEYFRVTRSALQHDGVGHPDFDRLERLGLTFRRWRKGRHVLVCPPEAAWARLMGFSSDAWLRSALDALEAHTDRPIRVRGRDSKGPLADDLRDCHALVTHSSNAAVEAACAGVPVFVTARCGARGIAEADLTKIETPRYADDRRRWAAVLAGQQWTMDEMASGECWAKVGAR